MRTKVTLILVFLNVALFFYIFRFERLGGGDIMDVNRKRVLGAEAADIRTLEINGPGARVIALAKRGEKWFVTKPLDWPANPNAVSRIVTDLQFLEHETSFNVADLAGNGQSLADYGLDQPKLTVTFSTAGAPGDDTPPRTTSLRLGDTTKDGLRLYVLSPDGRRIHVVNQSLARSLALSFEDLRSDAVFTIPVFEASSLNLQTAAPASLRIQLRRVGGRWSFATPIIARASKTATELAINALNDLRVKSFVTSNPPAVLPSANPRLRISVEGTNRRETLDLGDRVDGTAAAGAGEYYAQFEGRDAVFTVVIPAAPAKQLDLKTTLDRAQETLRETRLLDFDARTVTAITLAAPNQPELTLQRLESGPQAGDASSWQIVRRSNGGQGPLTIPADRAVVARLLEQLSLLSAIRFQSDAPRDADVEGWGFNRPEREITLTVRVDQNTTQTIALQVGLPTQRDGFAYARLPAGSPSVYAVDPDLLQETPVAPLAWRDRLLRELPAGAKITALTLTAIEGRAPLYSHQLTGGETWATVLAAEPAPRRAALETVLARLGTLRAEEFVLDQFAERVNVAGEERPWQYKLEAAITLTGGAGDQTSTTTLYLTPRVGGTHQLAGSPANEFNVVFALEQPFLDALWTLTEGPRDPGEQVPKNNVDGLAPTPAPIGGK
ncbi:MAG: DUF4340 domain-containing protein [Verrucomicrobia bacterium]|nr:DUF4340 domain-containing protein [Verrucomicrobiota bacterium]